MERGILPANGVFSIGTAWCIHLMERSHAITGLELPDIRADLFYNTSDVVAAIDCCASELVVLPFESSTSV